MTMQTERVAAAYRVPEAVHVRSWAAILCGPDGAEERLGACAAEKDIPASLRRRLGAFGRLGVACGLGVAPQGDADIVFCSRHGDIPLAHQLLEALVAGEPLSPAGFSMSVHNTVPGVLDLARKARIGHTAITAGRQTLSAGLAEAWLRLAARPHLDTVLIYAETPLPGIYEPFAEDGLGGTALALCVSAGPRDGARFSLSPHEGASFAGAPFHEEPEAEFLARELVARLRGATEPAEIGWSSQGFRWSFGGTDATS
ncbi:MAG: beta-ketoacyl synthase chain length factor [Parvibaculum sp.]|nr:beta-ketoacyl synthase chain length factor [Parvibaculum sp.]